MVKNDKPPSSRPELCRCSVKMQPDTTTVCNRSFDTQISALTLLQTGPWTWCGSWRFGWHPSLSVWSLWRRYEPAASFSGRQRKRQSDGLKIPKRTVTNIKNDSASSHLTSYFPSLSCLTFSMSSSKAQAWPLSCRGMPLYTRFTNWTHTRKNHKKTQFNQRPRERRGI